MSSILSYLIPQKLAEFSTIYNKHIRVNDECGAKKLLVNGSIQSGKYIRKLWRGAFKKFDVACLNWKTILVLGVGGGTVIELLHNQFPQGQITAVDIDSMIIDIAKKYFLQGDISYIHFVTGDAIKYVQENNLKYDCIIIDIFVGNAVPDFVKTKTFLSDCKKKLTKKGSLCINYLQDREYKEKSEEFDQVLRSLFSHVSDFRIANNRFFNATIV
ncbi:MAG: hypothetical protein ACD_48C00256G0003 [uncultured bacterium]|nr:MAG: hypothetical protein ACD_48C00256G0003 [uncultured bacterium]